MPFKTHMHELGTDYAITMVIEINKERDMRTINHKLSLFLIPITAFMLQACGSKTAVEGAPVSSSTSSSLSSTTTTTTTTTTSTSTSTSTSTGTGTCSHTQNAYAAPHTYLLNGKGTTNGTGTAIQYTANIPAGIDQTLKVQIVPKANSYASMAILKSGADVTLFKDGVEVAGSTVSLPGTYDQNNLKGYLSMNQKSAIVDFSQYLSSGSHTYKIKINNVQSDINCRVYCPQYYDYSMWLACVQMNCNIGYEPAEYWSVQVLVETDATPCLTP